MPDQHNTAVAHIKPGDVIQDGPLSRLLPAGTVSAVAMKPNPGFIWDTSQHQSERSGSHVFVVAYQDGSESEPVNGARRVMVAR